MDVKKEYERIKELFKNCDENQLNLLDGLFWESARLRIELNDLHEIVKGSGLVKINPNNPSMQKELPVSRMITKVRANYLNCISKLSNILGKNISEDDDGLSEYE